MTATISEIAGRSAVTATAPSPIVPPPVGGAVVLNSNPVHSSHSPAPQPAAPADPVASHFSFVDPEHEVFRAASRKVRV